MLYTPAPAPDAISGVAGVVTRADEIVFRSSTFPGRDQRVPKLSTFRREGG